MLKPSAAAVQCRPVLAGRKQILREPYTQRMARQSARGVLDLNDRRVDQPQIEVAHRHTPADPVDALATTRRGRVHDAGAEGQPIERRRGLAVRGLAGRPRDIERPFVNQRSVFQRDQPAGDIGGTAVETARRAQEGRNLPNACSSGAPVSDPSTVPFA